MMKKRLLRAIINSGVSAWKEFTYDEKKMAILEVTPYTYNTKYGLATLTPVSVSQNITGISVETSGTYQDLAFAFEIDGVLNKLNIADGTGTFEPLDIEKSPVMILSKGNTKEELETVTTVSISSATNITVIAATKFTHNAPMVNLTFSTEDEEEPTVETFTLTINTTPAEATVDFTCEPQYNPSEQGKSITANKGASITYTVTATGYETKEDTVVLSATETKEVQLTITRHSLTIVPTPAGATASFTCDEQYNPVKETNKITADYGAQITYTVSFEGYTTSEEASVTLTDDQSVEVTLQQAEA